MCPVTSNSGPKIGTPLLLPLTAQVGAALLGYLRQDRPPSHHRHALLRLESPLGPLRRDAITAAFRRWARRAGITLPQRTGPHCLRHSLAVHLLRQGADLATIGGLLGHRRAESTATYLRLDVDELREVALPLPGAEEVQP